MTSLILQSGKDVNKNIIMILVVGICDLRFFVGVMPLITLVGLIISVVASIVVHGKITAMITGMDGSNSRILKENWLNYLIVTFVIAIPMMVFGLIEKLTNPSLTSVSLIKEVFEAIVLVVTIYALPIVFLKKQNVKAIILGIKFLLRNLKTSIPIATVTGIIFLIHTALLPQIIDIFQIKKGLWFLLPTMFVNILVAYFSFFIFAMATRTYVMQRHETFGS